MRILIALLLTCFCAAGQTLQYRNMNSTQLASNRFLVSIKSGALLTNPVVASGTITGSGSGLTNVTDANALPKAGGVMSGGLGLVGSTNTGPSFVASETVSSNFLAYGNSARTNAVYVGPTGLVSSNAEGVSTLSGRLLNVSSGLLSYNNNTLTVSGYVLTTGATGYRTELGGYFYWNGGSQASLGSTVAGTIIAANNLIVTTTTSSSNGFASYRSNHLVSATITVGASPFSWTNTIGVNVVVNFDGISVTGTVGRNGGTIFNTIGTTPVHLQPGDWTTATYTIGTPTATWHPW